MKIGKMNRLAFISLLSITTLMGCKKDKDQNEMSDQSSTSIGSTITTSDFGTLPDGKEVKMYTLQNENGTTLSVINYGGIITHLKTRDKNGQLNDIVLGYDSLSSYLKSSPYFGALIGRYGNRIAKGKFTLDGTLYTLPTNDNTNHLHGGPEGFDKVFWNITAQSDSSLYLTYESADGEQGYPGKLSVAVTYSLSNNDELTIDYKATTDKKTVVNLTQHTYFNLTGDPTKSILDHQLLIDAPQFLPVDAILIPTGELQPVANTPFDFNTLTTIGERINNEDEQLKRGRGYDHCWVFASESSGSVRKVAELVDPSSGRVVEVLTTEPGIQFYSGNFLDGTLVGKGGVHYNHRTGLCLETQHYPNSPNQLNFPSVVLTPEEVYATTTIYKFGVR